MPAGDYNYWIDFAARPFSLDMFKPVFKCEAYTPTTTPSII